jgi:hypothetical protein
MIDALNECSVQFRHDLLRGAQTFLVQYDARVVLILEGLSAPELVVVKGSFLLKSQMLRNAVKDN